MRRPTSRPVARAPSTSASIRWSVGCGASASSSSPRRSTPEQAAQLAQRLAPRALDGQRRRARVVWLVADHSPRRAGLHDHRRHRVCDQVVQLARDPHALVEHRRAGAVLALELELPSRLLELGREPPATPHRPPGQPREAPKMNGGKIRSPVTSGVWITATRPMPPRITASPKRSLHPRAYAPTEYATTAVVAAPSSQPLDDVDPEGHHRREDHRDRHEHRERRHPAPCGRERHRNADQRPSPGDGRSRSTARSPSPRSSSKPTASAQSPRCRARDPHAGTSARGKLARTRKPPPGRGPASNRPALQRDALAQSDQAVTALDPHPRAHRVPSSLTSTTSRRRGRSPPAG